MWRLIDRLGYLLAVRWTPVLQVRAGTILTLLGLAFLVATPLALMLGDTVMLLLTFVMSGLALLIGGLGVLETAVLAVKQDPDVSEDDLHPDSG